MSQSNAVYQPTTVTYEANHSPENQWSERRFSYLSQLARSSGPCSVLNILTTLLLSGSCIFLAIGLIMIVNGAVGYANNKEDGFYVLSTILGIINFGIGVVCLGILLRNYGKLRCCRIGKDPLNSSTGQVLTVNPSTDLLVTAQYAPVSELAYQPPSDDTEQSKLMPQENKDNNEDMDRMIERDPRIVLRPLNPPTHEET